MSLASEKAQLSITLPSSASGLDQDEEWCEVLVDGRRERVRLHDYSRIYELPGLYEKIIYEVLKCDSPRTVAELLIEEVRGSGESPADLRVLDLGAGNGMVGEELATRDVEHLVGVDIIEEAAQATERDRPGLYDDYVVADLCELQRGNRHRLEEHRFNCMTCVAALGFGDIPVPAFTTAHNLVGDGGWIAFNIKETFLGEEDSTGFSQLIESAQQDGSLEVLRRRRYRHRLALNRDPLYYCAVVGRKHADLEAA
ncbi:MAG: methyltransferase domain-containing protein [Candidatus Eiseniibacteriota bacterium]|jgi:predicted TPR repeat methyltransferase